MRVVLMMAFAGAFFALVGKACAEGDPLESLMFKFGVAEDALLVGKKKLDTKYQTQLEALGKRFQQAGDLEKVVRVRTELGAFREGETPLAKGFGELERIQVIYRAALARDEEEVNVERRKLYATYIGKLDALETELADEGKLELAEKVRAEQRSLEDKVAALEKERVQMSAWSARGRFHVSFDNRVSIYHQGDKIFRSKDLSVSHATNLVELKVGDHLLCSVRNDGGPRRFKLAFVSQDERYRVDFKCEHFVEMDEVLGKIRSFTEEQLAQGSREPVHVSTKIKGNPFDFANNADWVWGRGSHTLLAVIITAEMVTETFR